MKSQSPGSPAAPSPQWEKMNFIGDQVLLNYTSININHLHTQNELVLASTFVLSTNLGTLHIASHLNLPSINLWAGLHINEEPDAVCIWKWVFQLRSLFLYKGG